MHTHVIHFLLHSGTATSRHSRPGDGGPFFYPAVVGNSCWFRGLRGARQGRTSPSSHSPGTKPPLHPGTCSALPAGGHRRSFQPSRVPGPSLLGVLLQGFSCGLLASPLAGPTLVPPRPLRGPSAARPSRPGVRRPAFSRRSWVLLWVPRAGPGFSQEGAGPAPRGGGITAASQAPFLAWRPRAPVTAPRSCALLGHPPGTVWHSPRCPGSCWRKVQSLMSI